MYFTLNAYNDPLWDNTAPITTNVKVTIMQIMTLLDIYG